MKSWLKRKVAEFKELRTSRKVSIVMFIGIIIFPQLVSILSAVVISNISEIISWVQVPSGYVYINFDYTRPEEMNVSIPYYVSNPGISDLTDIIMRVRLYVNYTHNSTKEYIIREVFYKEDLLDFIYS